MTDKERIATLSLRDVVALTIYGEARSESRRGREAVAAVIVNRVTDGRYGKDARAVCLRKWQFSCWTPRGGAINYQAVLTAARRLQTKVDVGPLLLECAQIADAVDLGAHVADPVDGATHYMTAALYASDARPAWVRGLRPCATVEHHVFFNNVD